MYTNQYAVYQLKMDGDAIRYINHDTAFLKEHHMGIRYENYRRIHVRKMKLGMTPLQLRKIITVALPAGFQGHPLMVSDVIVVTAEGITSCYYVDPDKMVLLPDFLPINTSSALIRLDQKDIHVDGRKGSWIATDSIIIDGRQFFLLESEQYGANVKYAIVDDRGNIAAQDTSEGFDDRTKARLREYMQKTNEQSDLAQEAEFKERAWQVRQKTNVPGRMLRWQKAMENGEYIRSAEMAVEANYNMIDGLMNNLTPASKEVVETAPITSKTQAVQQAGQTISNDQLRKQMQQTIQQEQLQKPYGGRVSLLMRLHQKQKEVAIREGRSIPNTISRDDDMTQIRDRK